jgi:hypothetical protein
MCLSVCLSVFFCVCFSEWRSKVVHDCTALPFNQTRHSLFMLAVLVITASCPSASSPHSLMPLTSYEEVANTGIDRRRTPTHSSHPLTLLSHSLAHTLMPLTSLYTSAPAMRKLPTQKSLVALLVVAAGWPLAGWHQPTSPFDCRLTELRPCQAERTVCS